MYLHVTYNWLNRGVGKLYYTEIFQFLLLENLLVIFLKSRDRNVKNCPEGMQTWFSRIAIMHFCTCQDLSNYTQSHSVAC